LLNIIVDHVGSVVSQDLLGEDTLKIVELFVSRGWVRLRSVLDSEVSDLFERIVFQL
jgi:hypothetical protein